MSLKRWSGIFCFGNFQPAQRRFPGYSHRQLRGFRREEHTAAHVLCLFEPIGRVTQNMSKKAWRRTGNAACLRG